MVAARWTAWCAVMNSNPWTGSRWSPVQTRPRLLRGSPALRGAAGSPGGADSAPHAPPSSDRPCAGRRRAPPASPSSGSPGLRAQTLARVPRASDRAGPTRSSAAGTPAGTADGSSASWTLPSAPTMGCPRNRVNSSRNGSEVFAVEGPGHHVALHGPDVRVVGNGGRGLRCALAAYAALLPKRFPVADGVDPDVTLDLDDSVGGLDCPAAVSACAHWVAS